MPKTTHNSKPKHCGKTMMRIYIRKGTEKRKWIPVGYYCNECSKMIKDSDLLPTRKIDEIHGARSKLVDKIANPQIIVLDLGYSLTKVGFSEEKEPRFIFDTAIYLSESGESFIQKSDVVERKRIINLRKQIFETKENMEISRDNLEIFLIHVFEALEINPTNKSILVIEKHHQSNYADYFKGRIDVINNCTLPEKTKEHLKAEKRVDYIDYSRNTLSHRRTITSILFNQFNIAKVYFSNGELLTLYSKNQVSGVVVNIGALTTRIVPIYEGYIISHSVSVREVGGYDVEEQLYNYIQEKGIELNDSNSRAYIIQKNIRLASEEHLYVSLDEKEEQIKWLETDKLKRSINIINETYTMLDEIRFKALEILFRNEQLSIVKKQGSLTDAVIETIQKCDKDLAKGLYSNIILSGGGTMYNGFEERFVQDLKKKLPDHIDFNVIADSDRLISTWIGGSILGGLKVFDEKGLWVTKAEYNEKGSSAVDRCI
jgi:actin-related protein